mmetsp:Transcript_4933/g.8427  ORF Transcript_4933/g.8427 Transcript_4933/m.8427 type:complete len:128 (+) Transcript_4933:1455-1838(+)
MNLLCVVGISELLHENVGVTVRALQTAGIKLWLSSSDRLEEVVALAITSGLKKPSQSMYYIENLVSKSDILYRISLYSKMAKTTLLAIDGQTLDIVLNHRETLYQFMTVALKAPGVCLGHCSPSLVT